MCYIKMDYLFQSHLSKNTAKLIEEENIKKVSVPEAYLGPCQLPLMDLFAKIVKEIWPYTISA